MNTPFVPLAVLLLQWTLLLTLGWGIHWLLRHRQPGWRLILWRSILCFGVALPLVGVLRLPRINVLPPRFAKQTPGQVNATSTVTPVERNASRASDGEGATRFPEMSSRVGIPNTQPAGIQAGVGSAVRLSWWSLLQLVWFAGCLWEAIRLLRLQFHLRQIATRALAASSKMQCLVRQIQGELNIRGHVRVCVSDAISSPFLCGVLEPTILIPRRLVEDLPSDEMTALLYHEMAHQCRHDLAWCIGWRWMKAVFWFHPLVWRIPDAHVLACEEAADRIAARRIYDGAGYAELLAQLALRVLRVPPGETQLTLNATSHFSRRLIQLGRERMATWRLRHSVAALSVAAGLFVLTAGWQFAQAPAAEVAPVYVASGSVLVTVQDQDGKPIAGATLTPEGLRVRGAEVSYYGWRPPVHGPIVKAVTNGDGKALINYPLAVVPEEKLLTGEISFSVEHPAYGLIRSMAFAVDGTAKPITLTRGIAIRVAGYFGANRERVVEIIPKLVGESRPVKLEDWEHDNQGGLVWRRMSPGKHFLHLAGRRASGEIVYSDGVAFFGEQRDSHDYTREMKAGIRVEGRLDANVPRPVNNGWVQLSVHSDEANTDQQRRSLFAVRSGNTGYWFTYRPIAADGSFVFESVPDGEFINVIAYGDGFVSVNGVEVLPQPLPVGTPPRRPTRGVPQSFSPARPLTTIEVATERTATVTVVAKAHGKPVSGAKISIWPNVIQMPSGSRIFGGTSTSSDETFRALPPMPEPNYSTVTDDAGVAVLRNVPAFTRNLGIEHAQLQAPLVVIKESIPASPVISKSPRFRPLPNRQVDLALAPGQSAQVEVELQPKGKDFAGDKL